jgi:hypothetical protein
MNVNRRTAAGGSFGWRGGRMRADTGRRYRPVLYWCPLGCGERWGTSAARSARCPLHRCQMVAR